MAGELILLVDDEPDIIQLGCAYLELEGFRVKAAADGKTALQAAASDKPALVILDSILPEIDGFEVCRTLRQTQNQVPILLLAACDDDLDKITSLELGADDYLTKPFNPRELVSRVKAILRRSRYTPGTAAAVIHLGDLTIDPSSRQVHASGRLVELRSQEFEVLHTLAAHRGQVLTREQLLSLAWGYDFYGQTRTVDVHIASLRRKLESSRTRIETVTGVGYKLVA